MWWPDSVAFVIVASMYANVVSDLSVAEAADDNKVLDRLDELERMLTAERERAERLEGMLCELLDRRPANEPADETPAGELAGELEGRPADAGDGAVVVVDAVPSVDLVAFVEWRLFELFGTVDPEKIRDAGGDVGYIAAAVDLAAAREAQAAEPEESGEDREGGCS